MKGIKLIFALLGIVVLLTHCGRPAEKTEPQTLYTTVVHNSGEDESTGKYLEIAQRSEKLAAMLEEKAGAFVMCAYNYQDMDGEGTPLYEFNGLSIPVEVDPHGRCVTVSRNYFDVNPIETVDGRPVEELLVEDDMTMNLLVPDMYRDMEAEIAAAHREDFYFQKVTAENDYNELAGIPDRLDISPDSLHINIIYVKDGQSYPSYRADCLPVTDPVAQVYTGNIHCNYAHSFVSQWLYFPTQAADAQAAYQEIAPYVEACGAGESVQNVKKIEG